MGRAATQPRGAGANAAIAYPDALGVFGATTEDVMLWLISVGDFVLEPFYGPFLAA